MGHFEHVVTEQDILAGSEKVTVTITGSQIPVGESENTYEIAWGEVAESDYEITPAVDDDGDIIALLPDKTQSNPKWNDSTIITEEAPTISGYVVDKTEASITLSFNEDDNVITFYYITIPEKLYYDVHYVLRSDPDIKVAESQIAAEKDGDTTTVLETAAAVDKTFMATQQGVDEDILSVEYRPEVTYIEQQLQLEDNVITFYYIPYTTSKIVVN